MRRKWITVGVLAVVLAGGAFGFTRYRAAQASSQKLPRIVPGRVQRTDLKQVVTGTAPIGATAFQFLKADVNGTVVDTKVNEGDRVKKGQVVMVLTNDALVGALEQARQDLAQAQLALDTALNPTNTQIKTAQIKLDQATITLANRKGDVANLTVTAPFAGVVTNVKAVPGDNPAAGAVVATVYDPNSLHLVAALPQSLAQSVRPGQAATVTVDGLSGPIDTKVTLVAQQGTSSGRESQVPVSIAMPDLPGIKPGIAGSASISLGDGAYPIQAAGYIAALTQLDVRTRVAGTYTQVPVSEGRWVDAGTTLAVMDSDTLKSAVATAQADVKSAQLVLDNLQDPTRDAGNTLKVLQSKIDQGRLTLSSRQQDVDHLTIYAPADGTISGISNFHPGDKIVTNQQLVKLLDYSSLQVVIPVDELDIAKVKVGQPASASFDALPGKTYIGTVSRIAPEGTVKNDIANFDVWVVIDTKPEMKAGMNAQVSIEVDRHGSVLAVPVDAVKRDRGGSYVTKAVNYQPGDRAKNTPPSYDRQDRIGVKTGLTADGNIEIQPTSGDLKEGDIVVAAVINQTSNTSVRLPGGGGGGFGGGGPGGGGFRGTPPGGQRAGD